MSEFFSELKERRKSQNIDLEELHTRTKIHLEYLQAIEDGKFDILPLPYIRLFLRAYVNEIGGNPKDALQQLEIYLAKKEGRRIPKKRASTAPTSKINEEIKPIAAPAENRPPTKIRADLIKGAVLLVVFLFAIFIIKKINTERSAAKIENGEIVLNKNPEMISAEMLINDYVVMVSRTDAMNVTPPLSIKIVATEKIWYILQADSLAANSGFLSAGEERSMSFEDRIYIRVNQTVGTNIYINGVEIDELGAFNNPAVIEFLTEPRTVNVKHYQPLNS